MVKDPETGEFTIIRHNELKDAYYMRQISDEVIVRAFKALTASCISLCVGKKVPKEFGLPKEEIPEGVTQEREVAEDTIVVNTNPTAAEGLTTANPPDTQPTATAARKKGKPKKKQEPVEIVRDLRDPKDRDWKYLPFQACAFFEDKIDRDGELGFDTQVYYYELPFNELPTQPPSLVRNEAYIEKTMSTVWWEAYRIDFVYDT